MSGVISIRSVIIKGVGTFLLAIAFVAFVTNAPFLTVPDTDPAEPAAITPMSPAMASKTGAMQGKVLPGAGESDKAILETQTSFGLFNARFASSLNQPGFSTEEHEVPGSCAGAGRRFFESECPDCVLIGDSESGGTPMLLWRQVINGTESTRAVSSSCTEFSSEGVPIVGSLTFGDDAIDLTNESASEDSSDVPLLAGAVRVASISLGAWSATYDDVARPSSALPDMASALVRRGWREVTDAPEFDDDSFAGHRVFVNAVNELCMISLSRQGTSYQLLTIINSQA